MSAGAVTIGQLLDQGRDQVVIACEPCKRTGCYRVQGLVQTHGRDATLPDLLAYLTRSCNRPQAPGQHRRCNAIYRNDW